MEEKKALFTKKRIIAIVIAVVVALLLIFGIVKLCGSVFSNEVASGNLGQNRGIAAFDGSLTFYNKDEKGLIKVKGNKEYQIVDESPYSITVVGDTVYYTTISNTGTIDLKSVKNNIKEEKIMKRNIIFLRKFLIVEMIYLFLFAH